MPMIKISSDIWFQEIERSKDAHEELKRLKRIVFVFISDVPAPLLIRMANAEKQIMIEYEFSEEKVENPSARTEKLRGYVC